MSEDRVRRIVREEIAMTLVKIVKRSNAIYSISDHDDIRNGGLISIAEVVNFVADEMVRDLSRTSAAGPQ